MVWFARVHALNDVTTIETPENVEMALPLAGIGSRFLAYLVDLAWQSIAVIAALAFAMVQFPRAMKPVDKNPDGTFSIAWLAVALVNAILFAVNFFYFIAFEAWRGQTPGKRVCGLRVVRDYGQPLDGRGAFVRNLLRPIDFLPVFYLAGVVVIFLGRKGKRIGDYAAGTIVIKEPVPSNRPILSVALSGLTGTEGTLVGEFLARRSLLVPSARTEVARRLADRIAERHGQPPPADAEEFLERLARNEVR